MTCQIEFNSEMDGYVIAKEANITYNPKFDIVISRVIDNKLAGGVVYSDFNPGGSISMHFAGFHPRWICRELIWVCFDFPFNQLKVKKIFAQVPSDKPDVVDMDQRFGFLRPMVVKDVFENADLIVMDMYRDECKWLKLKPQIYRRGSNGQV